MLALLEPAIIAFLGVSSAASSFAVLPLFAMIGKLAG